jgi:hypothetical protein
MILNAADVDFKALEIPLANIDNLKFHLLKLKLKDVEDGEGWSDEQCEKAESFYKRFLKLVLIYPDERIIPTQEIDTFWHYHILDTRKYMEETISIYGEYLHHYPYLGLLGVDDKANLIELFRTTQELYELTFQDTFPDSPFAKCDDGGGNDSTCAGRCSRHK